MMRILFIGGPEPLNRAFSGVFLGQGYSVASLGASEKDSLFDIPSFFPYLKHNLDKIIEKAPAAIVFIGYRSLFPESSAEHPLEESGRALEALSEAGIKLFYYSAGKDFAAKTFPENLQESFASMLVQKMQHIFLGSADTLPLFPEDAPLSWLGLGTDKEIRRPEAFQAPDYHDTTVLYLPFEDTREEAEKVIAAIENIRGTKLKFNFLCLHPSEISNLEDLYSCFTEAHIVLEGVQRNSLGFVGYHAMAAGKTVLSGKGKEAQELHDQMRFSPVQEVRPETLESVLSDIVREPKCVRDFSKRSFEFAKLNFPADRVFTRAERLIKGFLS